MAATKKPTTQSFQVHAKVSAFVGVDIHAATLEDALLQGRNLKLEDFITIEGDHLDSDGPTITGIFQHD